MARALRMRTGVMALATLLIGHCDAGTGSPNPASDAAIGCPDVIHVGDKCSQEGFTCQSSTTGCGVYEPFVCHGGVFLVDQQRIAPGAPCTQSGLSCRWP